MSWPYTEAQQAHADQVLKAFASGDQDAEEAALLSTWAQYASVAQLTDFVRRIRKNGAREALKAVRDGVDFDEIVDRLKLKHGD